MARERGTERHEKQSEEEHKNNLKIPNKDKGKRKIAERDNASSPHQNVGGELDPTCRTTK